ncbi:alpha/beta hydrolase [Sphingomonas sp. BN140010]|uniref:Alpha/beta hydrolase n=1 Tax=Sphingomonas arvum TaxID=2992113 RepID=A0ABT3JBQ2_9SPHN|nr:alpha/beta hydrolase [Sphingomonas sp. BN140010]MCW3796498.1 alpha/beta hydrolase [Sphingomonas sp. BN140010]
MHINFHGGAFLIGAPQQDEHVVRLIAAEVGSVVINVDYSRAPKVRFPHAHEECFDVLRWAAAAAAEQGWDGERITISGGSAGGNLALGALELARRAGGPAVCAAVLVVPAVDVSAPPSAYVSDIPNPFVGPSLVRTMQAAYFPDEAQRSDPLASPLLGNEEIDALPPLLIMTAEHDSLRKQQDRFIDKALLHGVAVTFECFPGVDHDFNLNEKTPAAVWDEFKVLVTRHLRSHL